VQPTHIPRPAVALLPTPSPVVHFTVSLSPSNEEVYSTRTSNAPFEFSVGATTVPIAFNKLVTSMKCGEIAKATVTPKYAWGEQGSEAYHVPPNATVVIEMELLEVIKTANLLKDETGTLNKRILKDVTGEYKKPNLRASVTGTFTAPCRHSLPCQCRAASAKTVFDRFLRTENLRTQRRYSSATSAQTRRFCTMPSSQSSS